MFAGVVFRSLFALSLNKFCLLFFNVFIFQFKKRPLKAFSNPKLIQNEEKKTSKFRAYFVSKGHSIVWRFP